MTKYFLILILILLILAGVGPVWVENNFENFKFSLLTQRQEEWPNWHLPSRFKRSGFPDAVIYPDWFAGNWKVYSCDLLDSKINFTKHFARFQYDSLDRIVADRVFNSESLGREVFGGELLSIKEDPKSQNRQLAVFKGDKYLETKVITREQQSNDSDTFLADEIVLQIYHSPDLTKINQVETLGRYKQCNLSKSTFENNNKQFWICGEQWQAVYKEPGQDFQSNPIHTTHYQIIFIPLNSKMPSENFLIDLAKRKVALIEDDL